MKKFVVLSAVACLSSIVVNSAYSADCTVDRYSFVYGSDSPAHMTTKSGKLCWGKIVTRSGGVSSVQIGQQPADGVASAVGVSRWQYQSRSGYVGKDSFTVQISGESMKKNGRTNGGTANLIVDVDVTN
jgi:hypothetical protein